MDISQFLSQVRLYSENHTLEQQVNFAKSLLNSHGILLRCQLDNNRKIQKIMINGIREKTHFDERISFEANGIILDPNWNVLVYPSSAFNPRSNLNAIKEKFDKYKVYKIQDGTVINLYYFRSKWLMATSKGYEVNDFKWMSNRTYQEIFDELMENYPEFQYEKLDKGKCYTIGFRHNDHHIFLKDPSKMWFIQSVNTKTLEVNTSEDVGLPCQEVETILFDELEHNVANAYSQFKANGNITYGYVLRSEFGETTKHCNLIVESDLLTKIRQMVYNVSTHTKQFVNHENIELYTTLRNYLNYETRGQFSILFPQFKDRFEFYSKEIENIVSEILLVIRTKNRKVNKKLTPKTQLVNLLSSAVGNFFKFNSYDKDTRRAINDFICDPKFVRAYLDYFTAVLSYE